MKPLYSRVDATAVVTRFRFCGRRAALKCWGICCIWKPAVPLGDVTIVGRAIVRTREANIWRRSVGHGPSKSMGVTNLKSAWHG